MKQAVALQNVLAEKALYRREPGSGEVLRHRHMSLDPTPVFNACLLGYLADQ